MSCEADCCILLQAIQRVQAFLIMLLKIHTSQAVGCNLHLSRKLPSMHIWYKTSKNAKKKKAMIKVKSAYLLMFNLIIKLDKMFFASEAASNLPSLKTIWVRLLFFVDLWLCFVLFLALGSNTIVIKDLIPRVGWLTAVGTAYWMVCFTIKNEIRPLTCHCIDVWWVQTNSITGVNVSLCCNVSTFSQTGPLRFSFLSLRKLLVLWPGQGTKQHLVRFSKTSWSGLKPLFLSPQSRL